MSVDQKLKTLEYGMLEVRNKKDRMDDVLEWCSTSIQEARDKTRQ